MTTSGFLNAEYGVIGALLVDAKAALPRIAGVLVPEDFALELNRQIFRAALDLREAGRCIDPVTIRQKLGKDDDGAGRYLVECMDVTASAANLDTHIELVKNASMLRTIRAAAEEVAALTETAGSYVEPLGFASDRFAEIMREGASDDLIGSAAALVDFYDFRGRFEDEPERMFVKTGYDALDEVLGGGFVNSGLYILAARPGVGKTTLALNIADNVAGGSGPVLFVTLEMTVRQITAKRLARKTGLSYNTLLMQRMDDSEFENATRGGAAISKLPVTVNRTPWATVEQIENMARRVQGLRFIVIDYLGLIRPSGRRKSSYEEMTETSGALKRLANRLGVPVLCLAQLNRDSVREKGGRPRMHHLRDSGAIEQDADGILLLHNPTADEEREDTGAEECICYVDKNRHGRTGLVKFGFYGRCGRFFAVRDRRF